MIIFQVVFDFQINLSQTQFILLYLIEMNPTDFSNLKSNTWIFALLNLDASCALALNWALLQADAGLRLRKFICHLMTEECFTYVGHQFSSSSLEMVAPSRIQGCQHSLLLNQRPGSIELDVRFDVDDDTDIFSSHIYWLAYQMKGGSWGNRFLILPKSGKIIEATRESFMEVFNNCK